MRRLINFFLLIVLIVAILFAGLFFMVELREDKIISMFKSRVEENLRTRIELGEIDANLIRKFPKASIELEKVLIYSVPDVATAGFDHNPSDTLCYLEKVYLEFSLTALLRGKYEINAISLHKGDVNILVDQQGNNNFTIWRKQADTLTKEPLAFNIENISYKTIDFSYHNQARQIETQLSLDKGKLNVNASEDQMRIGVKTQLTSQYFKRDAKNWFSQVPMRMQGEITKTINAWVFKNFDLRIFQRNKIELSGQLGAGDNKNIDLRFHAHKLVTDQVMRVIPYTMNKEKWSLSAGHIQVKGTVKGEMRENNSPRVDILFNMENARIKDVKRAHPWEIVQAKGTFSNGSSQDNTTTYLGIDKAVITSGKNNKITIDGSIQNFNRQYISLNTAFQLDHHVINTYLGQSAYTLNAGELEGRLEYNSELAQHDSLNTKILVDGIKKGYCHIRSVEIKGRESVIKSAGKLIVEKDWQIDSAHISTSSNTIHFRGAITDPLQLFQAKPVLTASVSAQMGTFRLKDFIAFVMNEKQDKKKTGRSLQYRIKARAHIDELVYNKVNASQVKVSSTLENNSTRFHAFESRICEGEMRSDGALIRQNNGTYYLKCQSQLKNINIHQLFYQFNNFKQTFLVYDNIQGNITGEVDYYSEFDSTFAFQKSSLFVNTDISVENGELVDFEPLFALSKYIDLEELSHVRFDNMENNILIKDQTVFIPHMLIKSSAMDIGVSGKHYFDNTFDYNVQVKLAEILAHKFSNRKKTFEDVGYIVEEEGKTLGIPLRISGNPENNQVRYNREQAKTSIKQAVKDEKQEIKQLFQPNDKKENEFNDQETGKVVWEEEEQEPEETRTNEKDQEEEPSFRIEWDD